MLLGLPGCFSAYAFAPVRHLRNVRLPFDWSVVIASSGVSAEKTGGSQGPYNHLVEGARVLLQLWNDGEAPADSLGAALGSSESAAVRLKELVERSSVAGWSVDQLQRRLSHFQKEDASVPAAARALDEHDAGALGEISRLSQQNAERLLLRQQVPETRALAEEAHSCGAFAACSFGAGFGGSVWALIERERAQAFASDWLARYRRRHTSPGAIAFVAPPGPPVTQARSSR
jgi:galactokinase